MNDRSQGQWLIPLALSSFPQVFSGNPGGPECMGTSFRGTGVDAGVAQGTDPLHRARLGEPPGETGLRAGSVPLQALK